MAAGPAVVTVNELAWPTTNARGPVVGLLAGLVNTAGVSTVNVNDCVTIAAAFVAVMVKGNEPFPLGVPLMVAVPSPLSTKVRPAGSEAGGMVSPAFGNPVGLDDELAILPVAERRGRSVVNAGAWSTSIVMFCVTVTPLLAVRTMPEYDWPVPGSGVPLMVPVPSP